MPFSNLLKSAAGTCPFCNQKAGILSREHQGCRRAHQAGWNEMVRLASGAARSPRVQPKFSQSLPDRNSQEVIRRCQYSRTGPGGGLEKGSQKKPPRTGASLTKRKSDSGGSGTGRE